MIRLDKYLAQSFVGTRKTVRQYVFDGKVTVNNVTCNDPAICIDENTDIVKYNNSVVKSHKKVYYMFNKPQDCITARSDGKYKTVLDYFTNVNQEGLFAVGRLDKDTEGLIFLTNDGDFDHQLMDPDGHIPKTYFFWALGTISEEQISKLENGVCIDKSDKLTKPAKLQIVQTGMYSELRDSIKCDKAVSIEKKRVTQPVVAGKITITEGKKHQVRRMLRAIGCYIIYLKRVSIGDVLIDSSLNEGEFRDLSPLEINKLIK